MQKIITIFFQLSLIVIFFTLSASGVRAASLSNSKDVISTSRPSGMTNLSTAYAATDTQVLVTNNGSRYLASDSARLMTVAGATIGNTLIIASQSANLTTVYLANSAGAAATTSDLLVLPITAKHTVQFTTSTGVPANGKIVLTFPGTGQNNAMPSTNSFSFNGLAASNISVSGASCGSYTIAAPTITCNLNAVLAGNTTVTLTIGSVTPTLINPTKSSAVGTADNWMLNIQTTDNASVVLDESRVQIATIESVKVYAQVDPSITFTIAGVNNGVALSTLATGCADSTQNTAGSTATEVNLGFLRNGQINIGAQVLTVSTNGSQGYSLTATSSGQFINPATGYWLYGLNSDTALSANDTPAPATFRASGSDGFGMTACGTRINTSLWGTASCTTGFSSGCKYSNPYNSGANSYYANVSSYTGGPISNDVTVVKYGASIAGSTPPGIYRNIFTYVATATF